MKHRALYVATSNMGKLRDFATAAVAIDAHWKIEPVPGLARITAPDEDGATFLANARIKALYYAQFAPGVLVVADDSGLVVDALGGAPGVYSARYASLFHEPLGCESEENADGRNNRCLMQELTRSGQPTPWTAQYRCVLAVARDGRLLAEAEGVVAGVIVPEAQGDGGFGYDPHFLLPQLGKTMAELDPELRLQLSHRGAALRALLPRLASLPCDR